MATPIVGRRSLQQDPKEVNARIYRRANFTSCTGLPGVHPNVRLLRFQRDAP